MASKLIEIGEVDTQAIRDEHVLSEVVSQYVTLKRSGGELKACCPFHPDRSPSFFVNDDKQFYHCFGCGAHGDVIRFIQDIEDKDFRGAVEKLSGAIIPFITADRIEALRERQRRVEAEDEERRNAATTTARERWIGADPNYLSHAYLDAKGIGTHGTRLEGDKILIPLLGDDGKIQTLQSIAADGRKLFVSDAPVSGGLFVLGGKVASSETPVIVCEGFATAATLQEATGCVVVCAFNSGNLLHVARRLIEKYPDKEYLVCGDDDRGKDRNPGREKGIEASYILRCRAVFPSFPDGDGGTDFNDMAATYDRDAVRALVIDGELPSGEDAPDERDLFTLLDMDELEALPPPTWLIDSLVTDHGLTIAYGPPGAYKSFLVVDMALRIAYGMDWHGREANQVGVLYVAGEGSRGLGKRVKGWRKKHFHEGEDAPFLLLPVAVQLLNKEERAKLIRTIEAAKERAKFDIGLIVIDTVSRSIAGQDENGQEAMSLFVDACADIQASTGGAVIAVHHSGKDIERGMRGSTVLLGGCDASLRVTKDEQIATLTVEKQKDAEELAPIMLKMETVQIATGLSEEETTLVPTILTRDDQPETGKSIPVLTHAQIRRLFDEVSASWLKKVPWSVFPQTRKQGRYLPAWMRQEFSIDENQAVMLLSNWQMNNLLQMDEYDAHTKAKGLRVLQYMED